MVQLKSVLTFATVVTYALAAPVLVPRQGAGVGQGCDAILSDADTSSGQVVKQAGAALAKDLGNGGGGLRRRQGAGVGAGCDAILSDADTSSGQVVKQGGAYLANKLGSAGTGAPSRKRQLDKMGAGVGYVVAALPNGKSAGQSITDSTGTIDGDGTNGSADLGEGVGQAELNTGNAVTETLFGTTDNSGGGPSKRQLDKMGAGVGDVVGALPGGKSAGDQITEQTSTIDGNATNGSADLGEGIGEAELDTGNAVTETLFGTTDGSGSGTSGGNGGPPPPPPPPGHH